MSWLESWLIEKPKVATDPSHGFRLRFVFSNLPFAEKRLVVRKKLARSRALRV